MGRNNSRKDRVRRGSPSIANRRLPTLPSNNFVPYGSTQLKARRIPEFSPRSTPRGRADLRQVEDRRRWHPMGRKRPVTGFNRFAPTIVTPGWSSLSGNAVTNELAFSQPDKVLVCVRRKSRREVLFAKNKNGRGGQKKPKLTELSKIKCRR